MIVQNYVRAEPSQGARRSSASASTTARSNCRPRKSLAFRA